MGIHSLLRLLLIIVTLTLAGTHLAAQTSPGNSKPPNVNFHLTAGGIIPSSLFRTRPNIGTNAGVLYKVEPKPGWQFGGMATWRLNRSFELHGGISLLRRSFTYSAEYEGLKHALDMRMTVYELPILVMYYQSLSARVRLTIGTGVNFQSILSDLGIKRSNLEVLALYRSFSTPSSLTIGGVEWRLPRRGAVFVGLAYNVSPWPLYDIHFKTNFQGDDYKFILPHVGDYFGITARYYID